MNNSDAEPEPVRTLLTASRSGVNDQARSVTQLGGAFLALMRLYARLGTRNAVIRFFASTKGSTALHHAARFGNVELCRVLVEGGADPTVRNAMGLTPLALIEWWSRVEGTLGAP